MVSILIPVYNESVIELVQQLKLQAEELKLAYEILIFDDASDLTVKQQNRELATWGANIRYVELERNLGRSEIRNLLFSEAAFDFCIVLDCDSEVVNQQFLQRYLQHKEEPVIYGGRSYRENPPNDEKKYLRWRYGVDREQIAAADRKNSPYRFFLTNNFAIQKSVVRQVAFDETIKGYGHEDTLFSRDLERLSIPILHIENPLNHIGLENDDVFLEKTKNALKNLLVLYRKQKISADTIPLLRAYLLLKKSGLVKVWLFFAERLQSKWEKNLTSGKPKLIYFDFYRLFWLCKLASTSS